MTVQVCWHLILCKHLVPGTYNCFTSVFMTYEQSANEFETVLRLRCLGMNVGHSNYRYV